MDGPALEPSGHRFAAACVTVERNIVLSGAL
jgi:hypothetical protein